MIASQGCLWTLIRTKLIAPCIQTFLFHLKRNKNILLSTSVWWSLITHSKWSVLLWDTGLHLALENSHNTGTWTVRVQSKRFRGLVWQLCYRSAHEYRQPSTVIVTHTKQLTQKSISQFYCSSPLDSNVLCSPLTIPQWTWTRVGARHCFTNSNLYSSLGNVVQGEVPKQDNYRGSLAF